MTQTRHIIDMNGKINVNYIGKLENVENDLKILLEEKDYPVCIIDDNISIKENNFRVFIMNVDIFLNGYINTIKLDLSKVNIILCLDDVSLNKTNNYLNNKELNINLADELYIFSIDNV